MWLTDIWSAINGFINNIFTTIFGDNIILATIFIAMLPIVELRGAIPFATNRKIWGSLAINNWSAYGWSLLGSSIIVPVIALMTIPMINWLKKTKLFKQIGTALENRVKSKSKNIAGADEKSALFSKSYWKKVIGVFIFVAIPFPFTGVWTGVMVALFLGLDYVSTCLSTIAGNIVAGLIITLILEFFPALNDWLLYIFIALIILVVLYELIRFIVVKIKNKHPEDV